MELTMKDRMPLQRTSIGLLIICLAAIGFRLLLAGVFVQHPGIADPNHYYNLGLRLLDGQGFTIDYIWNYFRPPEALVHPEDHWMPLAGVLAAAGMGLFGQTVLGALIPFVVIGGLLVPILCFLLARQFGLATAGSLFCAAAAAFLPEFVLNSVRTDTTIPNVLFFCSSIWFLNRALTQRTLRDFFLSGVCGGLSYLTRNDALVLLPMLLVVLGIYGVWQQDGLRGRLCWGWLLLPLGMILVAAPWLVRNLQAFGSISGSGLNDMFFYTHVNDHWAYGRHFTLDTMLAAQTVPELLSKRAFELFAAGKLMYTTLDLVLPVLILLGAWVVWSMRDRERWLWLAPGMVLLLGFLVAYPLLIPLKSQAGSFKKAYLTIIPLLLPLAGYALEHAVTEKHIQRVVMILTCGFLAANAFELVRSDGRFTNAYMRTMEQVAMTALDLPDTNNDGQIVLMAQDQFMLRFWGVSSIMLPMESRETILDVAQRYGADYVMMPPDRPALDPLYDGTENDPRFTVAARVPGTVVELYGFNFDASAP
jgi:hypothetical protein